jgi:hypothetical protein
VVEGEDFPGSIGRTNFAAAYLIAMIVGLPLFVHLERKIITMDYFLKAAKWVD